MGCALRSLGLNHLLDAHARSPGIAACWNASEPRYGDYLSQPRGDGWNLDRTRFDQDFWQEAIAQGVRGFVGVRLEVVGRSGGRTSLRLHDAKQSQDAATSMLVDATGRYCAVARDRGTRCVAIDRMIGISRLAQTGSGTISFGNRLLIEAFPGGWLYSLPVRGGLQVVLITDADLVHRTPQHTWQEAILEAPVTRTRLGCGGEQAVARTWLAQSQSVHPVHGPGWIAIGDAADARDPLASQGVLRAIEGGIAAADAIVRELGGSSDAIEELGLRNERERARYLELRTETYAREQRFPSHAFWSRRTLNSAPTP